MSVFQRGLGFDSFEKEERRGTQKCRSPSRSSSIRKNDLESGEAHRIGLLNGKRPFARREGAP